MLRNTLKLLVCAGLAFSIGSCGSGGCKNSNSKGVGPSVNPTAVPGSGGTSSWPVAAGVVSPVYVNGYQFWTTVTVTARTVNATAVAVPGSALQVTTAVPAGSLGLIFSTVLFGLPTSNLLPTPLGFDARAFQNGSISFDITVMSGQVDHFIVKGTGGSGGDKRYDNITDYIPGFPAAIPPIPVRDLYPYSVLGNLSHALQFDFHYSPVIIPAPFLVASINNLIWTP